VLRIVYPIHFSKGRSDELMIAEHFVVATDAKSFASTNRFCPYLALLVIKVGLVIVKGVAESER